MNKIGERTKFLRKKEREEIKDGIGCVCTPLKKRERTSKMSRKLKKKRIRYRNGEIRKKKSQKNYMKNEIKMNRKNMKKHTLHTQMHTETLARIDRVMERYREVEGG